jgi:hypothetical protein
VHEGRIVLDALNLEYDIISWSQAVQGLIEAGNAGAERAEWSFHAHYLKEMTLSLQDESVEGAWKNAGYADGFPRAPHTGALRARCIETKMTQPAQDEAILSQDEGDGRLFIQ